MHDGYKLALASVLTAGLVTIAAISQSAHADEFSAGVGYENGTCGVGEFNATVAYDRDSDAIRGHLLLGVSPNGSCSGQGLAVDAVIERQDTLRGNLFTVVGGGYDKRTVPFEYLPPYADSNFKFFRGTGVETASAHFGFGYDLGDNRYIQVVYNAVENRLADGGKLNPISVVATYQIGDNIELNATSNFDTHSFGATWDLGAIELGGSVDIDYGKLEHPAPLFLDEGGAEFVRAGAPGKLYNVTARWNF